MQPFLCSNLAISLRYWLDQCLSGLSITRIRYTEGKAKGSWKPPVGNLFHNEARKHCQVSFKQTLQESSVEATSHSILGLESREYTIPNRLQVFRPNPHLMLHHWNACRGSVTHFLVVANATTKENETPSICATERLHGYI